jgi:hypothetical protein
MTCRIITCAGSSPSSCGPFERRAQVAELAYLASSKAAQTTLVRIETIADSDSN